MKTYIPLVQVGDREWETVEPLYFFDVQTGWKVKIKAGYRFDLASVPRGLWWLIAPFELSTLAPLLHDWLYAAKGRTLAGRFTRKMADRLFLRIMRRERIPWRRRMAAYMAVRCFGWLYWKPWE